MLLYPCFVNRRHITWLRSHVFTQINPLFPVIKTEVFCTGGERVSFTTATRTYLDCHAAGIGPFRITATDSLINYIYYITLDSVFLRGMREQKERRHTSDAWSSVQCSTWPCGTVAAIFALYCFITSVSWRENFFKNKYYFEQPINMIIYI